MTLEQRRISYLERKLARLRENLLASLAFGLGIFPFLLREFSGLDDPLLCVQAGALLTVFLIMLDDWLWHARTAKREAALREQDFRQSTATLNKLNKKK